MRRSLIVLAATGLVAATAIVAMAVIGPPEVDKANATFTLTAADPVATQCAGEDAPDQYTTIKALWSGTETEVTPGATDYTLTGKLKYNASLTINLTTHRGVMTGTATLLARPVGGGVFKKVYGGPLTIVVQQVDLPAGLQYVGRGFLNAATFKTNAAGGVTADGGHVYANIEVSFPAGAPAFGTMNGQFGDDAGLPPEPVVKDYSVVTNSDTCS